MLIDWGNAETVALLLMRSYPDVDPSQLESFELTQMILTLPGIHDDRSVLTDEHLQAIQEVWNEEYAGERD